MNRSLRAAGALLLVPLLILPLTAADPPSAQEKLDASLRQLEKDIAAVRGLEFKQPVQAKIIARPKDANAKTQGYYDLKEKKLYVYDDVKGNYERGVLIHEMVHALQDQHFGLKDLHPKAFEGEEALARAALIEGDATFTMIELLKKDQPRVLAMLESPLEKAGNLENAFLYAEGARYVKALKEKGGWTAVNGRYRFPPDTTAEILHPEGVSTMDLGPGKVSGELKLLATLRDFPADSAKAPHNPREAAAGWRGDRHLSLDGGDAWVIAFGSPEQASRCRDALAFHETATRTNLETVRVAPGVSVWKLPDGSFLAVEAHGARVYRYSAKSEQGLRDLRDRAQGPPPLAIRTRDGKTLTLGELLEKLREADIVCIGENHDSDLHHRVQLQLIRGMFAIDDRLGVGMEMFQRPYQKEIDRYFAGGCGEEEFLKASEYQKRWGFEWQLYRPIVEFCKGNGVPLAALNVPRELTRRISQVGYAALNDDEKKQLGSIDFQVKEHRDYWFDRLAELHGRKNAKPEEKERGYQVMAAWDEFMADSTATFQKERGLRRIVVLAGIGHIERGFGIPARASKRTGGKAITIKIEVSEDLDAPIKEATTDYVIRVR
jgi:uncharacterized iron-regulated protein